MYRAIIIDKLLDHEIKTRRRVNEGAAHKEALATIARLEKRFDAPGRFEICCIEEERHL